MPARPRCSSSSPATRRRYAVFLITGGRLGDLYGRRRLFLLGMAGFTAANLLCGLAATPMVLVLGRMLLGLSRRGAGAAGAGLDPRAVRRGTRDWPAHWGSTA